MMTITPKQLPFTENGLSSKSNQSSIKNSNETLIRSNPLSHGAMQNHDENEARSAMLTDDLFVSAHQLHSDISSNNQHSSNRQFSLLIGDGAVQASDFVQPMSRLNAHNEQLQGSLSLDDPLTPGNSLTLGNSLSLGNHIGGERNSPNIMQSPFSLSSTSPMPAAFSSAAQAALMTTQANNQTPSALTSEIQHALTTATAGAQDQRMSSGQADSFFTLSTHSPQITSINNQGAQSAILPNGTMPSDGIKNPHQINNQPVTEWAQIHVDVSKGKWGEQMLQILQDRVHLQATQHVQEARIRLDPPELGKLDLFVRVEGDRLNVNLNASQVATREALAQISDRLRETLLEQHFVHVDVNVGSDQQQRGKQENYQEDSGHIFLANEAMISTPELEVGEHWLHISA